MTSDGEVSITEVAEKPFTQDMLDESVRILKFTLFYIIWYVICAWSIFAMLNILAEDMNE